MSNAVPIPKPIKDEEALSAALARLGEISQARPGTPEGEEMDLLSELIWAYEHAFKQPF